MSTISTTSNPGTMTTTTRSTPVTAHTGRVQLAGIHHVAMITADLDRFVAFYREVLDVHVWLELVEDGMRHAMLDIGGGASLHVFEQADNAHAVGVDAMFARGHLDHLALLVADEESFETLRARLVDAGASDGTIVDFGVVRQVVFRDPDGHMLELARPVGGGSPRTLAQRGIEAFDPSRPRDGGEVVARR